MRYRTLGRTGIEVSAYCLGAMGLGGDGNADRSDCARIIHAALDAGINFVDTADVYANQESEGIVGDALVGRRDSVVLATKFKSPMGADPNERGTSRRWIMKAVEGSLRRLKTDWIDLYQVHGPEFGTDLEETLSALSDLVHEGKVRAIGSSNFPAEMIVEAQWVAEKRGLQRFRCDQNQYSLFARGVETAVFPACLAYGMGAITWSPLNGSWLSGKYRSVAEIEENSPRAKRSPHRFDLSQPGNLMKFELLGRLESLASDAGLSIVHLAMAFVVAHPAVTAAIAGPRTLDQLEDLLKGASIVLEDDLLDAIDAIVPPGTTVNPEDARVRSPALSDPALRRRPRPSRSAG